MKKLFLLAFLGFFSFLSLTSLAIAENSDEGQGEVAAESATSNESPAEGDTTSDVTITLPDDLLTADCLSVYKAGDIINLEDEEVYKKQTLFIENLLFAQKSRFRLDPSNQSLTATNRAFIESNLVEERITALNKLKEQYSSSIRYCLEQQAQAVYDKSLADLEERKLARESEIDKTTARALKKVEKKIAQKEAKINKKTEKRLKRIRSEAKTTEKNFKRQIGQAASSPFATNSSASRQTTTLFKQKLEELPSFVESRESSVLKIKETIISKWQKREALKKKKIEKKQLEKKKKLEGVIEEKSLASKKIFEESVLAAPNTASTKADAVYQARSTSITREQSLLEGRFRQAEKIIVNLKSFWRKDKKKTLKALDPDSIDLESTEVTVQGATEARPKVSKSKTAVSTKAIRNASSGKKKKGSSLSSKGKSKRGNPDLVARVSWFNDSVTASGVSASDKLGVALNLKPGTASGWNNAQTDRWMLAARKGKPYYAEIWIKGKSITVPIIDKGPHESTGRGIDITLKAANRLGWSASNFPTDSIGKVYLLGQRKK